MSTEARREAIGVVRTVLSEGLATELGPLSPFHQTLAERSIDRLLETHAIVRRAPRVHRAARPADARPLVQRVLEGGAG